MPPLYITPIFKTISQKSTLCILLRGDYIGESIRSIRARHWRWGHRKKIRSGADGLGKHFLKSKQGFDLQKEESVEDRMRKHFTLTIIASVEPGKMAGPIGGVNSKESDDHGI